MVQKIGDYGEMKAGEHFASGTVRFNRFVTRDTGDNTVKEAGTSDTVIGLVEFDLRAEFKDGSERTGWEDGEPIPIKISGEGKVVAAEDLVVDDLVTMGASGTAAKYTRPTVSSSPAQAEVESIRDMDTDILGRVTEDGDSGEIVTIELNIAGQ